MITERRHSRMPELPAEIIEDIAMKLVDIDGDGQPHVHIRARAKLVLVNRRFMEIVLPIFYQCTLYHKVHNWLVRRNGDDEKLQVSSGYNAETNRFNALRLFSTGASRSKMGPLDDRVMRAPSRSSSRSATIAIWL